MILKLLTFVFVCLGVLGLLHYWLAEPATWNTPAHVKAWQESEKVRDVIARTEAWLALELYQDAPDKGEE